tara:strand:- start:57 stop:392 length:336 start_codon:yes stop_codon:yes gene_type:complete
MASANSFNISSSNGSACTNTETSGRTMETGVDYNSVTRASVISVRFKVEFGRGNLKSSNCAQLYDITVARDQLALDKASLELELLRAQIAALQSADNSPVQSISTSGGDDW